MDTNSIKKIIYDSGADFCGIASIGRFTHAPEGFNPADTLPSCKSVIIFGKKFLRGTLSCNNNIPYTVVRNNLSSLLDLMAVDFCGIMEDNNITAVPIGTIGPTVKDKITGRTRGIVSLKHAAVLAGLGYIGKNSLLINPDFGNMLWLTGVLAEIDLEPDPIIDKKCPEDCDLCIKSCPVNAIPSDSTEIDQGKCFLHAFHTNEGESFYFKCHKCRTVCPNCFGSRNKQAG